MSSDPLAVLLPRCALRDQRAFAQLYAVAAPRLYAVALRISTRRDWAEDILQESFVRIWHHAADYDATKSAPMTWMTAIVRNRALDWLRRPREIELDETQEKWLAAVTDEGPGPEDLLRQSSDAARLAACLQQLSEEQQRSIALAFFQGLSHQELSRKLQRPLGTVKTWIRRGLERLRGCLETA